MYASLDSDDNISTNINKCIQKRDSKKSNVRVWSVYRKTTPQINFSLLPIRIPENNSNLMPSVYAI